MKIYTKQGDKGLTRLGNGTQVRKDDLLIEALGILDELNASLGYAVAQHKVNFALIQKIQNNIFDIGAELALSKTKYNKIERDIEFLEKNIDKLQNEMPTLKNFILPGGCSSSAWLHICCTICRRAERAIVREGQNYNKFILIYINRLSDLLFCLARYENYCMGVADVLWKRD